MMDPAICVLVEARPNRWYYVCAQQPAPHDWRRSTSARAVGPFDRPEQATEHMNRVGLVVTSTIRNGDFKFDAVWHDLLINSYNPMFDEA